MLKAKALEICDRRDFVADRTWLKKFTNKYYGIKKLIHEWGPSYEYKKLGKKIKECKKRECNGSEIVKISREEKIITTKHNLFREEEEEVEFIWFNMLTFQKRMLLIRQQYERKSSTFTSRNRFDFIGAEYRFHFDLKVLAIFESCMLFFLCF